MIETELNARFAALADTTNHGSWAEVAGRAAALRRRHRLPLALAAALTVAVSRRRRSASAARSSVSSIMRNPLLIGS